LHRVERADHGAVLVDVDQRGGTAAAVGGRRIESGVPFDVERVVRAVQHPDVVVLIDGQAGDAAHLPLVRQRLRPGRIEDVAGRRLRVRGRGEIARCDVGREQASARDRQSDPGARLRNEMNHATSPGVKMGPMRASLAPAHRSVNCVHGRRNERHKIPGVGRDTRELRDGGRNAAILEAAPDAVITMDHEGKVVELNSAAERIFGYRREDAAGRSLADLIIPARFRAEHGQGLARYLATGEGPVLGKRLEMPAMRADGTEFPAELSIARITTDGAPMFTGYLRDLTVQKQAEDALRASEERFRTLVEMSSDATFLGDGQGHILYATASLFRVMGYSSDELVGRSGFDLVHPDDVEMAKGILQGAVDLPGEHVPFLLRARHKDGSWRHVDGYCTNHIHNPAVKAIVVNFRDVSERKRAEEKQRRLEAH